MRKQTVLMAILPVLAGAAMAADREPLAPELLESAAKVATLSTPSPGEIFTSLSKYPGRPAWSSAGRSVINIASTNRPQIAMNIGTAIADGYLAIENQNTQEVRNIGRDVVDLARKLNVGDRVIARGRSIADFADNNDWNSLREELDATVNEINRSLTEQKDDYLLPLISLGAWLRSMQSASGLLERMNDQDAAEVLLQPGTVLFFQRRIHGLPERMVDQPLIRLTSHTLAETLPLMETPYETLDRTEFLASLGSLTSTVVAAITGAMSMELATSEIQTEPLGVEASPEAEAPETRATPPDETEETETPRPEPPSDSETADPPSEEAPPTETPEPNGDGSEEEAAPRSGEEPESVPGEEQT